MICSVYTAQRLNALFFSTSSISILFALYSTVVPSLLVILITFSVMREPSGASVCLPVVTITDVPARSPSNRSGRVAWMRAACTEAVSHSPDLVGEPRQRRGTTQVVVLLPP